MKPKLEELINELLKESPQFEKLKSILQPEIDKIKYDAILYARMILAMKEMEEMFEELWKSLPFSFQAVIIKAMEAIKVEIKENE